MTSLQESPAIIRDELRRLLAHDAVAPLFATTLATALQVNEERPLNGTHVLVVKFDLSNPQTRERDCLSAKFNLTEAALMRLGSKELENLAQSTLGKGQKKRMRERVSRWRAGTAGGNRLLLVVKLGEVAYLFEEHVVGTRLGSGPDGEPAFIREYRGVQQELSRYRYIRFTSARSHMDHSRARFEASQPLSDINTRLTFYLGMVAEDLMAVFGSAFHLASPTAVHDHALVLVVSPRDPADDITNAYTIGPDVEVVPFDDVGEAVRRFYVPIMDDDEAALAKHDVDTRLVELRQGIASMPSDDVFCGCVVSVPPHHFGLAVQLHLLPTLKSGLFDPMQQRLIPLWAPKVVSGVLHPGEDWLTPFRERVELSDSVESRTIDVGHLRSFGKLSPREYARWKEGVSLLGRLSGIGRR